MFLFHVPGDFMLSVRRLLPLLAAVLLPNLALAHSDEGIALSSWTDGFNHPLHGWDHLVVMVAVGLWAAQQRGRLGWMIPCTFVGVMGLGGAFGAAGAVVSGVEAMILTSVIVFAGLVLARVRFSLLASVAVVTLFAFFHGFAHGQEMPGTTSLATFGLGFLVATALLHALGFGVARAAMTLAGATLGMQGAMAAEQQTVQRAADITVYGRQDNLIGIAGSATEGTVGADQLEQRPLLRAGEVLETVPGMIITQHAGGGKANQYFMRGFNLDHGTDFYTSLGGMPINLVSHGHGQGYSDMNIVIPELVERVNYQKGVYDAANGDFSSAGAAHLETFTVLPRSLAVVEGGMYGFGRGVGASSVGLGAGDLLVGAELMHADGPWQRGDNFWKKNGLVTYAQGDAREGFSLTARGYHGRWNSSDQVAESAVANGIVDFYSSLDDTTGGRSQRYSLQGEWHRSGTASQTKVSAYGFYYDLALFSNFTYFLTDPVNGDQFEQRDKRWVTGAQASHTLFNTWAGRAVETTFGGQYRRDMINNGLFNTSRGVRRTKMDEDGNVTPATARQDSINEASYGVYAQNKIQLADWLRSDIGMRADHFTFAVRNARAENTGSRSATRVSPKASLVFGPWASTEFYFQAGQGFHSNDARGVLTQVDPLTGLPLDADGNEITPADPLVRTRGAEVGIRTLAVEGLQSTFSVWMLDVGSELVFVGDAGTTEASRPSRRYGIEFANYYTPAPWLTLDADFALSRARYRDTAPKGQRVPGSIDAVVSAGVTLQSATGFSGSLRLRYFGPRPLIEDNSFRSQRTVMLNGRVGYDFTDTWGLSASLFNILGRRDHDITYAYESRVTPTAAPQEEIHFHPVEPRQVRVTLKARF